METPKRPNTAYEAMLAEAASRRTEALAMQRKGKSLKEIGEYFGVSRQRAQQMIEKAASSR